MKTLVATARTQGDRPGDFSHTVEGELVYIGAVCGRSRLDPDDECGCGRAFIGAHTHRATTTGVVAEVDLTRDELVDSLIAHITIPGWKPLKAGITQGVDAFTAIVDLLPVGTVVTRRLDDIQPAG